MPEWLQEIKVVTDMATQKLLEKLQQPDTTVKHLAWDGDLLRCKKCIKVGGNVGMQHTILQTLHARKIGGHSSMHALVENRPLASVLKDL
jgi:hypothetical protein